MVDHKKIILENKQKPGLLRDDRVDTVFCVGNGESRKGFDLERLRKYGKIYACNAIYREFKPDVLIAVDHGIIHEIYHSEYAIHNECYFRNWNIDDEKNYNQRVYGSNNYDDIQHAKKFDFVKTNPKLSNKFVCHGSNLTGIIRSTKHNHSLAKKYEQDKKIFVSWLYPSGDKATNIKEYQGGNDLGWAAGPTATWIAVEQNIPKEVYLIGHDLNSKNNKVNNLYKGTPNYLGPDKGATTSSNWIQQLTAMFQSNPDITFYKIDRKPVTDQPIEGDKVNIIHHQWSNFDNVKYITYEQFEKRLDKMPTL